MQKKDPIWTSQFTLQLAALSLLTLVLCLALISYFKPSHADIVNRSTAIDHWTAPDIKTLSDSKADQQIKYGRELIAHTAHYLGPQGTIAHISNGMNCQNCHLDAGTKIWGNNYSAVASTYPKFRARSGTIESVYKRINDCIERSLNGQALDSTGAELQAMRAYILWVGKGVSKGQKVPAGIKPLAYMDRSADTIAGRRVYMDKCQSCHGVTGAGQIATTPDGYLYPPLWGAHSYNNGAGLYRIATLAGYVKYNMPFGVNYDAPQLSDAEAWDVAAYINSQPRPARDLSRDWPDISAKAVDYPYGPYTDTFSIAQHKYGPYEAIAKYKKLRSK